jgi:hypothetical protein
LDTAGGERGGAVAGGRGEAGGADRGVVDVGVRGGGVARGTGVELRVVSAAGRATGAGAAAT